MTTVQKPIAKGFEYLMETDVGKNTTRFVVVVGPDRFITRPFPGRNYTTKQVEHSWAWQRQLFELVKNDETKDSAVPSVSGADPVSGDAGTGKPAVSSAVA